MTDPTVDQIAYAAKVVDEQQRGDPREVGVESHLHATHDLFTDPPAADVEIDGDPGIFCHLPNRVPVLVPEVRQVERLRLIAEVDAPVAAGDAPLNLGHRCLDVPERERHDREQPVGGDGGEVHLEVVVCLHALQGERGVAVVEPTSTPEAPDIG